MNTVSTTILNTLIADVRRYRFARLDLLLRYLPVSEQQPVTQKVRLSRDLRLMKLPSGMEIVFLNRKKPAPLQGIARGIAIHTFCSDEANQRTFLMSDEICRYFPNLFRNGMPSGYYVDTSGDRAVLGFVRVDTGFDHVVRIRQQMRTQIERHSDVPGFAATAAAGQFEITFLVPTESKARIINNSSDHRSGQPLHYRAVAIPVLLDLLMPLHMKSTFPDVEGL